MIWNSGSQALTFSTAGAKAVSTGAPPAPSGVTPVLTVGYVDASGTRHWDSVSDNVTTITGTAPLFIEFYGGESVSAQADSDTPEKAFWDLGFLMDYGEGLGGNWSVVARPKDTDRGLPMFAHTYTTVGTHEARMTCRDSAGNQAFIRVNVVVTDPGAGVDMTSGVIPTFASSTVYNAPAGGTWGNIAGQLDGLHNVIIRKTGAGADPVFGTVNLDSRFEPTSPITRTRGVRFLNCDVADVTSGNVGFDYCSFTGGRVHQISPAPMEYYADQVIATGMTQTQAENVRMGRGLMLQSTGDLNDVNGDTYVVIGEFRGLHFKDMKFVKTNGSNHNFRGVFAYSSFRCCIFNNTVSAVSYMKMQGLGATLGVSLPGSRGTPDAWPDNDMVVTAAGGRRLGLPATRVAIVDCQFGEAGGVTPVANAGFSPQNNDVDVAEGCEISGYEYCNWIQTSNFYTLDLSGRYLGRRDCRLDLGAGGEVSTAAGVNHPNRVPIGWEGPYYTTGTRPVVVP